ncbi:MAG: magnesium transporter [Cardiobacteriaceae bacterium]|nr:magnesium transporter [Cardiobacteriaceae bacterium]
MTDKLPTPNATTSLLSLDVERIYELSNKLLPDIVFLDAGLVLSYAKHHELLSELVSILHELHPADIATALESLPPDERRLVWFLVIPEEDGDVLLEVSDSVRESLIEDMDHQELLAVAEDLDVDELVELSDDLPQNIIQEALLTRDADEKAWVEKALHHEDGSVGAVMDFELVSIRQSATCEALLRYLRRFKHLPHNTDKIFVVDDDKRLVGVLPIRTLLVSDESMMIEEVMARDIVRFRPDDDVEEAAAAFARYDLITAPVVDHEGYLLGRITIDEMVDVIREESETDMLNMAGLKEEEDLFAPVWKSVQNRWLWIMINLCTALLASYVIGHFSEAIEKIVALAALMPIVAGIGGNSGNQTITMIVRAIAMGQSAELRLWQLLRKEWGVALVNGILWGGVMALISFALYRDMGIALVMLAAMTLNLLLAATVGVLIPIMMERWGRDPALGSSVLITAFTDSCGFLIFLGLANAWLL